jgi:uncharacterized iron-regulated membrane protein
MGLVVALLSITGIVIWFKKRVNRQRVALRSRDDRPDALAPRGSRAPAE